MIEQLRLKVNQNISILNQIKTNKNLVSLLKNMKLLNQKLMKQKIIKDVFRDCRVIFCTTFEKRCVKDINFLNMESNEELI